MLEREIIGKFIDACVKDHAEATHLLSNHPTLKNACWMGDEHLLTFLVIENFADGVSFCLRNGFNPNHVDGEMGTTPLHYACMLDYTEIAKLLASFGAETNAVCKINDFPLHCAIKNGNAEVVDCLIQHGADPNYITDLGDTIFDNWPPWAESELQAVIEKHNVEPNGGTTQ